MWDINALVPQLPYWSCLTPEEQTLVTEQARLLSFAKGQPVLSGSECLGMVWVVSGAIRLYILSEEGREVTLFRLYQGEPCVFSASCVVSQITFDTMITAEQDTCLLVVPSHVFGQMTEENLTLRCYMYERMLERFSAVMWTMQEILFKGFDRRLAAFLVGEYDRTGSVQIRMTHQEIAKITSSAREVVARMLKRFEADGLVEYKRGCVTLRDIPALRTMR